MLFHKTDEPGRLVISLDCELYWGVRDILEKKQYHSNLVNALVAAHKMVELFDEYDVKATWAVVGLLFDDVKQTLRLKEMGFPYYSNKELNPELDIKRLLSGELIIDDCALHAKDFIDKLNSNKRFEIATHTYTHYYCNEMGAAADSFRNDIECAIMAGKNIGLDIVSIVFPRNQVSSECLRVCKDLGIKYYRGQESGWYYNQALSGPLKYVSKVFRFIDSLLGVTKTSTRLIRDETGMVNVQGGVFVRFDSSRALKGLRIRRIKREMLRAAKTGGIAHLWWHPHNMGSDIVSSLGMLAEILQYYKYLEKGYGMRTCCMSDVA